MATVTKTDEKILLLQLKQGYEPAFETLYNNYKPRLAGNLFKLLKSDDLVKEILQELFFKIWKGRAQIDPEKKASKMLSDEEINKSYFIKKNRFEVEKQAIS